MHGGTLFPPADDHHSGHSCHGSGSQDSRSASSELPPLVDEGSDDEGSNSNGDSLPPLVEDDVSDGCSSSVGGARDGGKGSDSGSLSEGGSWEGGCGSEDEGGDDEEEEEEDEEDSEEGSWEGGGGLLGWPFTGTQSFSCDCYHCRQQRHGSRGRQAQPPLFVPPGGMPPSLLPGDGLVPFPLDAALGGPSLLMPPPSLLSSGLIPVPLGAPRAPASAAGGPRGRPPFFAGAPLFPGAAMGSERPQTARGRARPFSGRGLGAMGQLIMVVDDQAPGPDEYEVPSWAERFGPRQRSPAPPSARAPPTTHPSARSDQPHIAATATPNTCMTSSPGSQLDSNTRGMGGVGGQRSRGCSAAEVPFTTRHRSPAEASVRDPAAERYVRKDSGSGEDSDDEPPPLEMDSSVSREGSSEGSSVSSGPPPLVDVEEAEGGEGDEPPPLIDEDELPSPIEDDELPPLIDDDELPPLINDDEPPPLIEEGEGRKVAGATDGAGSVICGRDSGLSSTSGNGGDGLAPDLARTSSSRGAESCEAAQGSSRDCGVERVREGGQSGGGGASVSEDELPPLVSCSASNTAEGSSMPSLTSCSSCHSLPPLESCHSSRRGSDSGVGSGEVCHSPQQQQGTAQQGTAARHGSRKGVKRSDAESLQAHKEASSYIPLRAFLRELTSQLPGVNVESGVVRCSIDAVCAHISKAGKAAEPLVAC